MFNLIQLSGDWSWSGSWKADHSEAPSAEASPRRLLAAILIVSCATSAVILVGLEIRCSWIEAYIFPSIARHAAFRVEPGSSASVDRPGRGPYDQRLGFSALPQFTERLESRGFQVVDQSRDSAVSRTLTRIGLFPVYHEKDQAGLRVLDRQGRALYFVAYPHQIYPSFASIPPLVVHTLLFIENREMLEPSHPRRNPAVQWGRLSRAAWDLTEHAFDRGHSYIGGSTLATQLEKIRHSPGGRTGSVAEKARQMISASLRAYQDGPTTLRAQQEVIRSYLNSIGLAATAGQGEVIGLADGLRVWYGADFKRINKVMAARESTLKPAQLASRALAYREVLSLLLALRAPSRNLVRDPGALAAQTSRYLRALCMGGIISPRLRNLALRTQLHAQDPVPTSQPDFVGNKACNAIRTALLPMLGVNSTYALDRLDLTVHTTIDGATQKSVSDFLDSLANTQAVDMGHLDQRQLLESGNPKSVIYSFTLYERGRGANLLRVRTDTYDQPLDISEGTRLQLGSTAKLRTLIEYLQIIATLHREFGDVSAERLKTVSVQPNDQLTRWTLNYLSTATDRSLEAMLEAALLRKYPGSPAESFFTAGGLHHFDNFEKSEDGEVFTVSQGFQQSANLVFIRLMRDIEAYYIARIPGVWARDLRILSDPARQRYLERFADLEGQIFLRRFYDNFQGQSQDQAMATLLAGMHLNLHRAAVIFRSVHPNAGIGTFTAFLRAHLPAAIVSQEDLPKLYDQFGPDRFDLSDRGYLAGVHPLALWLLHYLDQHPKATLSEVIAHSSLQRQEVYGWLFRTRFPHAQDERIRTMLEIDAFRKVHRDWQELGYPFGSLVPSYATSIGVSGDTPQALAELVGILVNDGVRYPTRAIDRMHFGKSTPFETVFAPRSEKGRQVLSPLIARLVRQEMIGVVENGTGRRVSGGFPLPGGKVLPIGGKTGTGDNRFHEYGSHGQFEASRVVNRTAAFAFFIGDRFFGTILAFVPGKAAANYTFTSALAVQVLKDVEPLLVPLSRPAPAFTVCGSDSTRNAVVSAGTPSQNSIRSNERRKTT